MLNGVHEFDFLDGILLLEGRRVDPSPPVLFLAAVTDGLDRLVRGVGLTTVSPMTALVEERVLGIGGGIEYGAVGSVSSLSIMDRLSDCSIHI